MADKIQNIGTWDEFCEKEARRIVRLMMCVFQKIKTFIFQRK